MELTINCDGTDDYPVTVNPTDPGDELQRRNDLIEAINQVDSSVRIVGARLDAASLRWQIAVVN